MVVQELSPETSLADLLHQPVRWRLVQALIGRSLTTGELAELLPDVPTTTLYRHVGVLVKAGVLVVTDERRVRGAVERTYSLDTSAADPDNDAPDRDRLRTMFTVYLAGLAGDFDRYLARDDVDPVRDGVSLRQAAIWISDDELPQLQERLTEVLDPVVAQGPGPGRTRRILSTIFVPDR
ncbi:helix-turn-helix domain-containing protein [Pseudonocardia sp. KRD291]|uniref:helix-turn-helix domain-containing protein n=1 Tax=Pseudonocardia sp. KRD291 TaxID=2792007 RepID=UPI001C4A2DF2|nr:helix-turn-helix domain-containing protein [Pseudonocardia sp. KRD291]MBW0104894.1 helix-turn-helix domain-containing protein [Pseudonocardia sp. KRD291]